jgi:N-ethylmaleimide reductase
VVQVLDDLKPVYLHVIEGQTEGPRDFDPAFDFHAFRKKFHRTYMANNGYTLALAANRLAAGVADLIAFGRPFVANPDLVECFRTNEPLASADPATFYGGDAKGEVDYPAIKELTCHADRDTE